MAQAYGTITIVDMTDVGQFTVVPMSNVGTVFIYDEEIEKFNVDKAILTPYAYYAGTDISDAEGISYVWYKKLDGASFDMTNLEGGTTGKTVYVTPSTGNKSITYYLKATYMTNGLTLTAWGQITFTIMIQHSKLKHVNISGDNIFRYNYTSATAEDPTLLEPLSIILTAEIKNVTIDGWFYYAGTDDNGLEKWRSLTSEGNTCTVEPSNLTFINNQAKIKVTTSEGIYDTYTIYKLIDGKPGADGANVYSMILSNEDQMIACDSNWTPLENAFDLAKTTISIYKGSENVTSDGWEIKPSSNNVNGSLDDKTYIYTATGYEKNSIKQGSVTFTATLEGASPLTKTFSLTSIKTGADGKTPTVYQLSVSPNRVATNENGCTTETTTLTPTLVSYDYDNNQSKWTISEASGALYDWAFSPSLELEQYSINEDTNICTIYSNVSISQVICSAKMNNSSVDSQSIIFVPQGKTGNAGAKGEDALTLVFPQEMDTISLDSQGYLDQYSLEMPYYIYQGTNKLKAKTFITSVNINGVEFKLKDSNKDLNDGSTDSKVTLSLSSTTKTQLYNKTNSSHYLNGSFEIPIYYSLDETQVTEESPSLNAKFTWNLSVAAKDAVSFTLNPTSTIFNEQIEKITITPMITSTSETKYAWFKNGTPISSEITTDNIYIQENNLVVKRAGVDGMASIECKASCTEGTFYAQTQLTDYTDEFRCEVISEFGDKIINSNGGGIIWCRLYRNGEEIQKFTDFPEFSSISNGTITWKDGTNKIDKNLPASIDKITYTWSYNGLKENLAYPSEGKAIYLDQDYIDKKLVIKCDVTIEYKSSNTSS